MIKRYLILSIFSLKFILGQYDYSLQDINSTSETYETYLGPAFFIGQVTLHYFGHQY